MCLLVLDAPSVDHFSKRWPPTCFNRWKNRFHPRLPWNLTGTEGETISMSWVSNAASRIITWLWVRLKTNYVTTGFWGYPICRQTHMNQGKETVVTVVILDKGDNLDSYEWKCNWQRNITRCHLFCWRENHGTIGLRPCPVWSKSNMAIPMRFQLYHIVSYILSYCIIFYPIVNSSRACQPFGCERLVRVRSADCNHQQRLL